MLTVDRFTAAVVGYGVTLAAMGLLFGGALLALIASAGQTALLSSPVASVASGRCPRCRCARCWIQFDHDWTSLGIWRVT